MSYYQLEAKFSTLSNHFKLGIHLIQPLTTYLISSLC